MAGAGEPVSGPEIAGVIDELRFRLFSYALLGGLILVAVAVALSIMAPGSSLANALGAGVLMSVPLLVAGRFQLAAWRAVCRRPAWTLLIGPLDAAAGLLADPSAFLYPSLAWIAAAAIAGGMRWSLAAAAMLTLATTMTALLDTASWRAALLGLPSDVLSRLFFAIAMSALANGLSQIVWIRSLAASPAIPAFAGSRPVHVNGLPTNARVNEPPVALEVVDCRIVDVVTPAHAGGAPEGEATVGVHGLTVREKEVIVLLAAGLSLAQAADALGITYRAARARTDRARTRADARTTPELVRRAIDTGCVPRPDTSRA